MILSVDATNRLDLFLVQSLPSFSRTKLSRLISDGVVRVDGVARKPSFELRPGMQVELDQPEETSAHNLEPAYSYLEIVHEDEFFMVINKPRGLASHPAPSLKSPSLVNVLLGLRTQLSTGEAGFRPGIVHRLDRETTGLMLIAKTDAAHADLARQIASKTAERRYFAIVKGVFANPKVKIDAPMVRDQANRMLMKVSYSGKAATTHVKTLQRLDGGASFVACRLETGRTHQIRVHLSAAGHPVKGDLKYAPGDWQKGSLQLHAGFLSVTHPISKELVSFYAKPPSDFECADLASRELIEKW